MRITHVYHNNGDISFRLHPEPGEEQKFHSVMSRPPGGCKDTPASLSALEYPVISKDGMAWERVGPADAGTTTNARRLIIDYSNEDLQG